VETRTKDEGSSVSGAPHLSTGKRIIFAAFMLVLSLLLLEAGLRGVMTIRMGPKVLFYGTSHYRRRTDDATAWVTDNKLETGFGTYTKYLPNDHKFDVDDATGEKFQVAINRHGFRGKDYEIEKAPGTIRVVTLGASSTFGYYDRDTETYPYLLEERLTELTQGRISFEVINLGIPHLTSRQILALLHAEALPLHPDVVTFYEGINDASQTPKDVWTQKVHEPPQTVGGKFRAGLSSLFLLRKLYGEARDHLLVVSLFDNAVLGNVLTYSKSDYEQHIAGKAEEFISNVSAMRDACRETGIVFIVLKQQARSMSIHDVKGVTYEQEVALIQQKLDRTNAITHQEMAFLTHRLLTDSLEAWAHAENVPFLDVMELLNHDRDVLLSWVHLSPRGNRMIADALATEVLSDLHLEGVGRVPVERGSQPTAR
jgi:lysophospholipase L1-like esterase